MAEIAGTAKKVVGMTATLINGYASGIFHLLFRLTPAEMVADGQEHADPWRFCREYGVVESTFQMKSAEYNANRRASRTKKGERMLPGVSPLVYSRFLLENTVFLSLMDMGKDLPEYEEIPVGLTMRPEVRKEYQSLSEQFLSLLRSKRGAARKLLFTLRQASRRSWRINQTAPRVEVYFFYYRDTIQERAMQLMASNFGTDLQTAIRCEMQGDVETGGAAVVNAQLLTGMLNLTGGDRVSVESLKNDLLCLKCQNTEYTVATLKPDLLTKAKLPVPDTMVRLTGLRSLERLTTFAAAKKDPKQTLECVRLEVGKNTGQAAACDGRRLIVTREKAESGGTLEELCKMQRGVSSVRVPAAVNELMDDILIELRRQGIHVSDRKYFGYYPIVQAHAWLCGRDEAAGTDLTILRNYLWTTPDELPKISQVLTRLCENPLGGKISEIRKTIVDAAARFEQTPDGNVVRALQRFRTEAVEIHRKISSLRSYAQNDTETAQVDGLLEELEKASQKAHAATNLTYIPMNELEALLGPSGQN